MVGEIIAGLVIGPCLLNLVQPSDSIAIFAEIGVVLLMFTTGLGTNLQELMRAGPIATLIACVGVAVPLAGGTLLYSLFYGFSALGSPEFYRPPASPSPSPPCRSWASSRASSAPPSSAQPSLMMSSASWCSPVCWVPAAAQIPASSMY